MLNKAENGMKKIAQLTSDQFMTLKESKRLEKLLKKHVGLADQTGYALGDTAVTIPNPELYGIYRNEWNGKMFYYLVVSVMGPELAFAWSLYPILKVGDTL
ncbi:hypothetical protein [Sporomusa sp.]|uniref:hypothetical protein n=1 Tax=Sporomusa sp. TaxID=2078658 RepID=UPI002C186D60|nr:hypothetical protein [Sporomusa sp.]HWR06166.1 hypothetical protein [Sporomusa sp.]